MKIVSHQTSPGYCDDAVMQPWLSPETTADLGWQMRWLGTIQESDSHRSGRRTSFMMIFACRNLVGNDIIVILVKS